MNLSYYQLKISGKDVKTFIKNLYKKNIKICKLDWFSNYVIIKVDNNNYKKILNIKTIYDIKVIKYYGLSKIINYIKNYYYIIIGILLGIIANIILSNIIFEINVLETDKNIKKTILTELKYYGIKKYSFFPSYEKKEKIKNNILNNNKDILEWLEITKDGSKYIVKVEKRIINDISNDNKPCNIVAVKDGIITKITSNKGEIIVKKNQYVKKGDVLISGNIYKNDDIKNIVHANGDVYAEVWYKVKIDIPYHYYETKYLNKFKRVFKIRIINKDYYLFNIYKYKDYKEKIYFSINNDIVPITFIHSLEQEIKIIDEYYDNNSLVLKGEQYVKNKINKLLNSDENILLIKLINNIKNADYAELEYFVKTNEKISTIEYVK